MNLTDPFAVITPTLDGPVLSALLALSTVDSGAGIHRGAGAGSAHGVRKVLRRMVGQGIVEEIHNGGAVLYRLNREHIAYDAIVAMGAVRNVLVARLSEQLDRWPDLIHASLPPFGPGNPNLAHQDDVRAARDTGRLYANDPDADLSPAGIVRVVLVGRDRAAIDTPDWRYGEYQLNESIEKWTGNSARFDVLCAQDLDRLAKEKDPTLTRWRRTNVQLAGLPLHDLLGRSY